MHEADEVNEEDESHEQPQLDEQLSPLVVLKMMFSPSSPSRVFFFLLIIVVCCAAVASDFVNTCLSRACLLILSLVHLNEVSWHLTLPCPLVDVIRLLE